jgi:hypothetical protein
MLSAVACPATRIASLSDHEPVCGSIASRVYFDVVYIRHTASRAAGARAAVWELITPSRPMAPIHVSGDSHSNV